jgi:ElaB/YqjD/DUF883 family membrane-anchored ribosome-binding protein
MRNSELQDILQSLQRVVAEAELLSQAAKKHSSELHASTGNLPDGDRWAAIWPRDYARRHPLRTLGIATGIGFLVGCMLSRRRDKS